MFEDEPEREKKSWREIDAGRDRGFHKPKPKEERGPRVKPSIAKRQEALARKALDELFQGRKSKEQEAEWKKVLEGSPRNFSARADEYVAKFGLPRQWDDLLRLLDHKEAPFVSSVLDRLNDFVPNEKRAALDLLSGKLRILKMEREEPELIAKMDALLTDLAGRL